ncbi:MAG: CopG family transcriptional regulator [Promethearchaeota archaeon CR_4]|nr:MAG: CopG family transcriptional regulator [Candidatus Lokiarchaeota archaeon CR_4]
MRLVTLHLPEAYDEALEILIDKGLYPNRSEAIRMAVRDLLKSELGNSLLRQKESSALPSL